MDRRLLLLFCIAIEALAEVKSETAIFVVESSELCSSSVAPEEGNAHLGSVYRFHNETQRCYKIGEKGPCGELMKFYADPTNGDYGDCDCDLSLRCHRPLVYWPEQARCYMAFEQGPCNTNEWLTLDSRSQRPRCEANPCTRTRTDDGGQQNSTTEFDDEFETTDSNEPSTDSFWFFSHETGECYKTNTQGQCTFPNERAVFNGFEQKLKPRCIAIETTCSLPKDETLICAPGQQWAVLGHCFTKPKCTRHGRRGGRGRGGRKHYRWHSRTQSIPDWSVQLPDIAAANDTDTMRSKWSGFLSRHHHHHHFHNHSSVGPQWKRNSHLKRTSAGRPLSPVSRKNTNYIELERVDFRNNGDEFIGTGGNQVAEVDPSGEKK